MYRPSLLHLIIINFHLILLWISAYIIDSSSCSPANQFTTVTPNEFPGTIVLRKCGASQWRCRVSGKCIPGAFKCNGRKDCDDHGISDSSDETIQECKNSPPCSPEQYRCDYGACLDANVQCNGVPECVDKSDEDNCRTSLKLLTTLPSRTVVTTISTTMSTTASTTAPPPPRQTTTTTTTTSPDHSISTTLIALDAGICDIPFGPDKTVVLTDDNENWLNVSSGSKAPKFSKIEIFCNSKYALANGEKIQRSVCLRKEKWSPPLKNCSKTCPNLRPENVILTCYREGLEIDCKKELINGTSIRPRCRPLYHSENVFGELKCQENGEWSNKLPECIPDCGVTNKILEETQTLITDGERANSSDSPWNVAVYRFSSNRTRPILICGGTLISPIMVISAAHCFYDNGRNGLVLNSTSDYEIVVSKYTRDYQTIDNAFQRKFKIREIIFTDTGYNPHLTGQFSNDIAVLILKQKVDINKFVLPACVDWNSGSDGFRPAEGLPGKLVGWGADNVKYVRGSPILQYADLPYIGFSHCLGKLKQIDSDKFCAGSPNGTGPGKGDSGGGLMFRDPNSGHYVLRGVVSTTDRESRINIATFTDVSKHIEWLVRVRDRVTAEFTKTDERAPVGICDVPYGPDKRVDVFDDSDNWLNILPGAEAPKFSKIEVACNPKYTTGDGETYQRSVCFQKGKWNPPLKPCSKTCPKLHPVNVDLTCHRAGTEIDCNSHMFHGTSVQPRCKPQYRSEGKIDYRQLRCQENGEWDNELFECVTDCGLPKVSVMEPSSPTEWKSAQIGDSPWNVAVYWTGNNKLLLCGGTIISPYMVVSAAYCYYKYENYGLNHNASEYVFFVSKLTRDYDTIDNGFQKMYEIRDIIFTDTPYDPQTWRHHGNDIVVLVPKIPIDFNKFVLPACIDWTSSLNMFQPADGTPGKMFGWNGTSLMHAEFPFVNLGRCLHRVILKNVLGTDKFCAGLDKVAEVYNKGEVGGGVGLVFRDPIDGRYILRGVGCHFGVLKHYKVTEFVVFTDVSTHLNWLKKLNNRMQEELKRMETMSTGICDVNSMANHSNSKIVLTDDDDNWLNSSALTKVPKFGKIEITCNPRYALPNGEKIQQSVCFQHENWNPPLKHCLQTCAPLRSENMHLSCYREGLEIDCNSELIYGTSVRSRCKPLFQSEREESHREVRCQENGEWDNELVPCLPNCGVINTVPPQTSITQWVPAKIGEFPWHVTIYSRSLKKEICGGTLISANMIVSEAKCFYNDSQRQLSPENVTTDYELVVSKLTKNYEKIDNDFQRSYEVAEMIYPHKHFDPYATDQTLNLNDIVVFIPKVPIEINKFVLPACVDWKENFKPVEGALGTIVGYIPTNESSIDDENTTLHLSLTRLISFSECRIRMSFNEANPDQFCADIRNESRIWPQSVRNFGLVSFRKCPKKVSYIGLPFNQLCRGDRTKETPQGGAALVLYDTNNERYFLRGVTSLLSPDPLETVRTFTDISKHLDWLTKIRNRVEKKIERD